MVAKLTIHLKENWIQSYTISKSKSQVDKRIDLKPKQ